MTESNKMWNENVLPLENGRDAICLGWIEYRGKLHRIASQPDSAPVNSRSTDIRFAKESIVFLPFYEANFLF